MDAKVGRKSSSPSSTSKENQTSSRCWSWRLEGSAHQQEAEKERLQRDGCLVHLYAGEAEGITLARAWKQEGGDVNKLLAAGVGLEAWGRAARCSSQSGCIHRWTQLQDTICPSSLSQDQCSATSE